MRPHPDGCSVTDTPTTSTPSPSTPTSRPTCLLTTSESTCGTWRSQTVAAVSCPPRAYATRYKHTLAHATCYKRTLSTCYISLIMPEICLFAFAVCVSTIIWSSGSQPWSSGHPCPACFRCFPAPTHLIQINGHKQASAELDNNPFIHDPNTPDSNQ